MSFSPSPRNLLVTLDEEMLKKWKPDSVATALASMVLPVPGGPKKSTPLGGARRPENRSGRMCGSTTASWMVLFAYSSPEMSLHLRGQHEQEQEQDVVALREADLAMRISVE